MESSTPEIIRRPWPSRRPMAPPPASVSWSVRAITAKPAAACAATTSAGGSSPSLKIVCRCRFARPFCEFCDIPGLYGRNPRLKTPQQITAELDKLLECGVTGSVYFVDDNFIGHRNAAVDLLPHLIAWQKRTGYVMRLACEATLNIAKRSEILEKMREAYFVTIFCGIETPDPDALKAMQKDHNMMVPILEGVHTINKYGMEVVSGIIMGLDTDKPDTGEALLAFVDESRIPLLTINLLHALPKTPLWDRLERENRLIDDETRDSNVDFRL